jgi:hypothetical protein
MEPDKAAPKTGRAIVKVVFNLPKNGGQLPRRASALSRSVPTSIDCGTSHFIHTDSVNKTLFGQKKVTVGLW